MFIERITYFMRDEDGAVAIEYALLAALIALAIIGGARVLGADIGNLFTDIGGCLAGSSCNITVGT